MTDSSLLHRAGNESSLDELALSTLQPPPPSTARPRSKTPLSFKSPSIKTQVLNFGAAPHPRGTSPSKSIYLETPAKPGSSPWRIKVTVQAEPNSDNNSIVVSDTPSKRSTKMGSRKITVPLKDADSSPVKRGPGRPRKLESIAPANSAIKKRKGTPLRRRSARLSADKTELTGRGENALEKPAPRPRGRPRKSLPDAEDPAASSRQPSVDDTGIPDAEPQWTEYHDAADISNMSEHRNNPSDEVQQLQLPAPASTSPGFPPGYDLTSPGATPRYTSSQHVPEAEVEEEDDADMWRQMVHTQQEVDVSTQDEVNANLEDSDASDSGDGGMEFTGHPIGDVTMMQSEEFSMVSLDSLRGLQSSFVDDSRVEECRPASKLSQAWIPDHSPTEPAPKGSSHQAISSRVQSSPAHSRRSTHSRFHSSISPLPTFQSRNLHDEDRSQDHTSPADRTSNNFHNVLSSPFQESFMSASMQKRFPVPAPTRSSVSKLISHTIGNTGVQNTHNPNQDKSLAPLPQTQPTATLPSQTRLPTPNSLEREPQSFGMPTFAEDPSLHLSLHLPPSGSARESPTKSDGAMSWQTQTPPSTGRDTPSSENNDVQDVEVDMQSEPPLSHRKTPKSEKMVEKEAEWQRAREEVSRTIQSAKSDRVVVIESDRESEDEEEEEEEEEDNSDLWQEEASRMEPSHPSHVRSTQSSGGSKSLSRVELEEDKPRPHKVARTWRHSSAVDSSAIDADSSEEEDPQPPQPGSEYRRQVANADQIAALFDSLENVKRQRESNSSPHVSFPQQAASSQSPPTRRHERHSSATAPSPTKGILKRRLSFGAFQPTVQDVNDEQEDSSELRNTTFNTTFTDNNTSMASDVRQIRREVKAAVKSTAPRPIHRQIRTVPTKLRSIDDSIEEDRSYTETSTMLSITPKHTPKRLFPTPAIAKAKAQQPHTAPVQEATVVIKPTTPTEPNLLSRVWSYLPFSYKPPPRPTHALLDDLPLLPKYEPWTRSHYLTLDRLYYRYLRNPSLFSPSHPSNKNILTPGFIPYIDIDIYNYGYEARLSTSHIILASLFSSLLVLNSFEEFKLANGGEDIDDSEKLLEPCKEGTKINEWIVVRRLFSLVGSKWVERDEERGLDPLGEREGDMRWRFAGQTEWIEWVGMEVHGEWDGRVV